MFEGAAGFVIKIAPPPSTDWGDWP